jgi:hypothetical protein
MKKLRTTVCEVRHLVTTYSTFFQLSIELHTICTLYNVNKGKIEHDLSDLI